MGYMSMNLVVAPPQEAPPIAVISQYVIREYPQAKHKFLRFQVGSMEERFGRKPVYKTKTSRTARGDASTNTKEQVFHLQGFGPTLEAAERRAVRMGYRIDSLS